LIGRNFRNFWCLVLLTARMNDRLYAGPRPSGQAPESSFCFFTYYTVSIFRCSFSSTACMSNPIFAGPGPPCQAPESTVWYFRSYTVSDFSVLIFVDWAYIGHISRRIRNSPAFWCQIQFRQSCQWLETVVRSLELTPFRYFRCQNSPTAR
jgi:hypothetical protein